MNSLKKISTFVRADKSLLKLVAKTLITHIAMASFIGMILVGVLVGLYALHPALGIVFLAFLIGNNSMRLSYVENVRRSGLK